MAGSAGTDVVGAHVGEWLAERQGLLERGEATWLEVLARFDRDRGWAADGQLSCVGWLAWRTGISRVTAFEKVRVAHQLWRRPAIAEAFADGRLSYSAVRAITRLDDPDPDVDTALVALAVAGPVRDVERAVRHYQLCAEQDMAPDSRRLARRGLHLRPGWGGLGTIEMVLDEAELAEVDAALRAVMDAAAPHPEAPDSGEDVTSDDPHEACSGHRAADDPVDDSSREDPQAPTEAVPIWRRRVDAFMDLVRIGLAHLGERHAAGDDRYLIHIVSGPDGQHPEYLDGTPMHPATASRVACDASTVLDLGRRTRQWSRGQRRAVMFRDGGTCRFPGCDRSIGDIHHLVPWAAGGPSDLANGLYTCTRHHTLLHEGFDASGDANHAVSFRRPDGSPIATTTPRRRLMAT